jgi:hypothetical protein
MLSAAKRARFATLTFVLSLTFAGCGDDGSSSGKDANAGGGNAGRAGAANTENSGGSAGFSASGAGTGGALAGSAGAGQNLGGASNNGGSTSHLGGNATAGGGSASGGDAAAGAGGASETADPCSACNPKKNYCQRTIGGPPGAMPHYQCLALPAGCGDNPSCACLASVSCGAQCMGTAEDGLMTTCLAP